MTTKPTAREAQEHDDELAHRLLASIRQIVRRISEHSKQLSRECGLTVPQLMCIKAIGELSAQGEPVTIATIGHAVSLSSATVSRIVDRLARDGWVSRTRGTDDRRRVTVALTAQGQTGYRSLPAPLQEKFVARIRALPDAERIGILGALQRISELMDAAEYDAAPILTAEYDMAGEEEHSSSH